MAKYRKKPVIIEAMQIKNDYESIVNAVEFVEKIGMETSIIGTNVTVKAIKENGGLGIETLEGNMKASFGDYIIKGIKGEFYPVKSDIFKETYIENNKEDKNANY
jgi:hypothetical protein